VLCTVPSDDDALRLIGRFIQYYRENARYLERTYGFVARVGIDKIRAVVVDDSEGLAARLDAEIERAASANRDPWLERDRNATPNQFRTTLPIVQ